MFLRIRVIFVNYYHIVKLYIDSLKQALMSEIKRFKGTLSHEEYKKNDNMVWVVRNKHGFFSFIEKE